MQYTAAMNLAQNGARQVSQFIRNELSRDSMDMA